MVVNDLIKGSLKTGRVTICSMGSPETTHLLINGEEVPVSRIQIHEITPHSGPIQVDVTLVVDMLDIDLVHADLIVKGK